MNMNDPELKAMSAVYDALNGLDATTRQRVTDWVLAKLGSTQGAPSVAVKATGAKRGRKPGSKKAGAKRGPKPATVAAAAKPAKKAGKRGRPAGSVKKTAKKAATKSSGSKRGRPRKSAGASAPAAA